MQHWGARGGGGREGTQQRPWWGRWKEAAGRRWAEAKGVGRGDWRGGVMGRPGSPWHIFSGFQWVGRAWPVAGGLPASEAQGVRRWTSAFLLRMRPCVLRTGSAGHSTWMPASLV